MIKRAFVWLLGCISLSAHASDIADISQDMLLKVDQSKVVIVDVRTREEYEHGHVPGAINLPLNVIADKPSALGLKKDQELVLYCRSGYRAGKAAKILQKQGYSNLRHLEGDMLGWIKAKLPVEK